MRYVFMPVEERAENTWKWVGGTTKRGELRRKGVKDQKRCHQR